MMMNAREYRSLKRIEKLARAITARVDFEGECQRVAGRLPSGINISNISGKVRAAAVRDLMVELDNIHKIRRGP